MNATRTDPAVLAAMLDSPDPVQREAARAVLEHQAQQAAAAHDDTAPFELSDAAVNKALRSADPREREWMLHRQLALASTWAKASAAPARLGDALAAQLSLSADPALRELAYAESSALLPAASSLIALLESGAPEDVEVALAVAKTSTYAINKIAGGR